MICRFISVHKVISRSYSTQSPRQSLSIKRAILFATGTTVASAVIYGLYDAEFRKQLMGYISYIDVGSSKKIAQIETLPSPLQKEDNDQLKETVELAFVKPADKVVMSADEVKERMNEITAKFTKCLDIALSHFDDYYSFLIDWSHNQCSIEKTIPGHHELMECFGVCEAVLKELSQLGETGHYQSKIIELREYFERRLNGLRELYDPSSLIERFQLLFNDAQNAFGGSVDVGPLSKLLLVRAHESVLELSRRLAEEKAFRQLLIERDLNQRVQLVLDSKFPSIREEINAELTKESQRLLDEQLDEQATLLSDQYASLMDEEQKRLTELYEHRLEEMRAEEKLELRKDLYVLNAKVSALENILERRIDLERRQQKTQSLWLTSSRLRELLLSSPHRFQMLETVIRVNSDTRSVGDKAFIDFITDIIKETIVNAPVFGIENDTELRKRFKRVARISKRVAYVDDNHRRLIDYLYSYFNALIPHFGRTKPNIDETDLETLTNVELIDAASQAVDTGNRDDLLDAVKILNFLKGEPKRAFGDWIRDAINFLTLDQSTRLLLAEAGRQCLQVTPCETMERSS